MDTILSINDHIFQNNKLDEIINNIEKTKNLIRNKIITDAQENYNNILLEISKL